MGGEAENSGLNQWVHSLSIILGCLDHKKAEACSITLVPEQLRRSKEEAYTPHVVSVGPLHKGKRTDLLYMEEIKLRCMLYLLYRCKNGDINKLDQVLLNCGKAMLGLDGIVRGSYNVDDLKLNRNDLAKIMVLDGCFLLELLISGSPELNEKLESQLDGLSSGIEVIQREKVLSDLIMLENQIPLIVLGKLFTTLFPENLTKDDNDGIRLIREHALSILGYDYSTLGSSYSSELKGFHFLELVHSFIDKEKEQDKATKQNANAAVENNEVNNASAIDIPTDKVAKQNANASVENNASAIGTRSKKDANTSHGQRKLSRCATRLEAAGIKIKPPEGVTSESRRASEARFDLKITFSKEKGILEIPQLHITETTEAKWRNLIAWEVNRITLEKQRGKKARFTCHFIFYAWFVQSLICSVHDLKLLKDRHVIEVHESMSNEDLMNMLRKITEGVPDAEIDHEIDMDSWFRQVINELNSYPTTVDRARKTRKVLGHIFRRVLTWIWYKCRGAYGLLRRDYMPNGWRVIAVLAAATALTLTAIQTHYAIHRN